MAKKQEHIHRYEKRILGKNYVVYACNLPGCTHYLAKTLVKGKLSLCNRCNEPMIMGAFQLTLSKPHCVDCTEKKGDKKEQFNKLKQLLEAPDEFRFSDGMDSGDKEIIPSKTESED